MICDEYLKSSLLAISATNLLATLSAILDIYNLICAQNIQFVKSEAFTLTLIHIVWSLKYRQLWYNTVYQFDEIG